MKAIRVLRSLLAADSGWFAEAWYEQIERVLRIGLSSRDHETKHLAYDTVNLLLRKGLQRFAEVLDKPGPANQPPEA